MVEKKVKNNNQYSDEDVKVSEVIEAIRENPGMYIGSADEQGWHHLFQEVIDNSVDEAVARYEEEQNPTQVKVILSADQKTITVEDNGRGIPVGTNKKTNKSTLETVLTYAHSGAKSTKKDTGLNKKAYKTAGGMHGIGLTAVNALSEKLEAWSKREGKIRYVLFQEGSLIKSELNPYSGKDSGTIISFTPDQNCFEEVNHFEIEVVKSRLEELARLNPYLSLTFFRSPEAEPETYHYEDGLAGWVQEMNQDKALESTEVCSEKWTLPTGDSYFHLGFAWQYQQGRRNQIKSFCNNISTSGGGTHQEGFESGLVKACQEWIKERYPNLKVDVLKGDVLEGLTAIVAVRMQGQVFAGQTKDRLANKKVREIAKNATYDLVQKFLQDHNTTAESIAKKIIDSAQIRVKAEEHHELLREGRQVSILPGKLADCISKKPEENEIFLVEGESAAGTAKLGRDCNIQAVLVLKGKVINVEKSERIKVFKNEEIKNLTNALGFNVNEATQNYYNRFQPRLDAGSPAEDFQITDDFNYEDEEGEKQIISAHQPLTSEQLQILVEKTRQSLSKKMRYGKIIIMTDADADGKHIECLVLTFFARYFRYLIEEHRLFLAVPPLYRVQSGKETKYLYSDQELVSYQQEKVKGYTVQRFKGLGEMNPQQLRETTMALRRRCLHQLLYSSPPNIRQIIEEMMGTKSIFRKQRLESGEHKHAQVITKDVEETDRVKQVEIDQALLVKFLTYAYEVVEDRALPQLQDGLKPVQRRILYTLYELGLLPNKGYRKAAKTVGDVMGKYHPHSDQSIYQAMVKMAQDFNYRYPLVDGQGNWGSLDGDPAAAMRYTEARLSPFGLYLLEDLAFETVEWVDNYDENEKEPRLLPASLNLLLNGSSGIAVGMSTNIPPHNLGELVDTTVRLLETPTLNTAELFQTFQGPDFPGGGIILEREKLLDFYEKGEGTIYIRGKAEVVSSKQEKERKDLIRISELPYKVNKAKLVERINQVIKDKKIEGLRSVADYSNWEERVNIHCRFDPNYDGNIILNKLYQSTSLQSTFSVKMRALIDDQPKIFSLKEILQGFIQQRLENISKKAQFIYHKNQKELINLETRIFIINNYQEIAQIASASASDEEREQKLKVRFATELQKLQERLQIIQEAASDSTEKIANLEQEAINRILDTPASFRQFTPERREKLEKNITELHQKNEELQGIFNSEEVRKEKLIIELRELQKTYAKDHRRTEFTEEFHTIDERKLTPHEERLVILSQVENKKENTVNTYLNVHEIDSLEGTNVPSQGKELKRRGNSLAVIKLSRRDDLWCFSNYGKLYNVNFYKFTAVNKSTNLREEYNLKLQPQEYITSTLFIKEGKLEAEKKLLVITKKGKIKLLETTKFQKMNESGKKVINLYQKLRVKCASHQSQFEQHKTATCCDKTQGIQAYVHCAVFKDLQKQVHECNNCKYVWMGGEDIITQSALVRENEEIEIVLKRQGRDGKTKNLKVSAYRRKRISYCDKHQKQQTEHKNSPHQCGISCPQSRKIHAKIKECQNCQKPEMFTKKLRPQVRCKEAVNLLIINPEVKKEDLNLLLIKEDNSCLKKPWTSLKSDLGRDTKNKKTKYCQTHWNKLTKSQEEAENLGGEVKEKKESLRKIIVDSPVEQESKKKFLAAAKIALNQEIKRKIANAQFEEMNDQARQNIANDLQVKVKDYQTLANKWQEKQDKLNKVKEESKKCKICLGYCDKHRKSLEKHKTATCCDKTQGIQAYVHCAVFKDLQKGVKNCEDCQDLRTKKHTTTILNPLRQACLFDQNQNYEIYLLVQEAVCWYNKKDLASFLTNKESRTKNLLRDKKRVISDIKIYPTETEIK